ncbi:complement C1q tumor necrosis factor-related protein 7-like [Dreissena polymorpha]|uniref:complement C1q tumor necrosis factor-related protein 7-like n=1 Tax=Dreissena polymorpha TaxID=45954 RepID=UPI0022655DC4|nr:complement C1q tumor necrosis factor-related protein 7-like [Dreissena polymorpha]
MEGRVDLIKGELQIPTIQFRAKLASSITVSSGQDVVFTRVEVNEGRGYDKGTGKFTASVAGLYHFAVHYCTQSSNWVSPEIVHNGKSLQTSTHYGASAQQCSSLQAYVVMSMGDMVWAISTPHYTSYFFHSDGWADNTFSGVLLHA